MFKIFRNVYQYLALESLDFTVNSRIIVGDYVVWILEEMAKLAQLKFCNRIVPFQAVVSMVG